MKDFDQLAAYKLIKQNNQFKKNQKEPFSPANLEFSIVIGNIQGYEGLGKHTRQATLFFLKFLDEKGYLTDYSAYNECKKIIDQIINSEDKILAYSGKQIRQLFELLQKLQKSINVANKYNLPISMTSTEFYKRTMLNKIELPLKHLTFGELEKLLKPKSEKII